MLSHIDEDTEEVLRTFERSQCGITIRKTTELPKIPKKFLQFSIKVTKLSRPLIILTKRLPMFVLKHSIFWDLSGTILI